MVRKASKEHTFTSNECTKDPKLFLACQWIKLEYGINKNPYLPALKPFMWFEPFQTHKEKRVHKKVQWFDPPLPEMYSGPAMFLALHSEHTSRVNKIRRGLSVKAVAISEFLHTAINAMPKAMILKEDLLQDGSIDIGPMAFAEYAIIENAIPLNVFLPGYALQIQKAPHALQKKYKAYRKKYKRDIHEILSQIGHIIGFLNKHGMRFKDLHPSNVLVTKEKGKPKVYIIDPECLDLAGSGKILTKTVTDKNGTLRVFVKPALLGNSVEEMETELFTDVDYRMTRELTTTERKIMFKAWEDEITDDVWKFRGEDVHQRFKKK